MREKLVAVQNSFSMSAETRMLVISSGSFGMVWVAAADASVVDTLATVLN